MRTLGFTCVAILATVLLQPVEVIAGEQVPLTQDAVVQVDGLPSAVDEGVVIRIRPGSEPTKIVVEKDIPPNASVHVGSFVMKSGEEGSKTETEMPSDKTVTLYGETIEIAPNLTVVISDKESLVSGPNGATLKRTKKGKGVILVKGEAELRLAS